MAEKPDYGLSKRELEVVELIIQGHQNKEIADKLFIFEKTGVKNRTELVGLLS